MNSLWYFFTSQVNPQPSKIFHPQSEHKSVITSLVSRQMTFLMTSLLFSSPNLGCRFRCSHSQSPASISLHVLFSEFQDSALWASSRPSNFQLLIYFLSLVCTCLHHHRLTSAPLFPEHAPSLWWTHSWSCLSQRETPRLFCWYCFIPHHNLHPSPAVPTCLHVLLHLFSILSSAPDCWPWVLKTLHSRYLYSLKLLLSTWVPFSHTFILSCCSSPPFLCVKWKNETKKILEYFTNLHHYFQIQ